MSAAQVFDERVAYTHAHLDNKSALEVSDSEQMWQSIMPWDQLAQLGSGSPSHW